MSPILTDLDLATDRLHVLPWHDPVIDKLGHDARSSYVEQFWLSILGPSTTWLLRRLAAGLDLSPEGFTLPLEATALALGLGTMPGRNGPFLKALARCCQFGLARSSGEALEVRHRVPPLTRRQVERLPEPLRVQHQHWQEQQLRTPPEERQRRRARRLALSLLELGEDVEATERQLHRWRYHPALAREATAWAWNRHHETAAGLPAATGAEGQSGSGRTAEVPPRRRSAVRSEAPHPVAAAASPVRTATLPPPPPGAHRARSGPAPS